VADGERALSNAGLLLENVAQFAHGYFAAGGTGINAFNMARAILAIAAIAATVLFCFVLARAARPIVSDADRLPEQRLLFVFWGVSLLAVSVAFVVTTAPIGLNAVRYVPTLWPALLTLVVIVYGRFAITGLALLATSCAVLGCFALGRGLYTPSAGPPPDRREAEAVERFAAENELDHGYAGYWDAAPLTIQSDFGARVYPIELCGPEVNTYCQFHSHSIEAWYEPKQGVRTFFVVNRTPTAPDTRPPPAAWGPPIKTATLGDLTVYAYDYDISSHFQAIDPGAFPIPPPGPG